MPLLALSSLALFAFVSSATPGPNTLMIMTSGTNFGFRRTIPHMAGVVFGFTLMIALVGIGFRQIFELYPAVFEILKYCGMVYLLYLSFKIATSAPICGNAKISGKPFTFLQAALFQWINPKAWTIALTAMSIYSPSRNLGTVLIIAVTFGLVNFPSVSIWALSGQQVRKFLSNSRRLRFFNVTMALLLAATLIPVLFL